jgi:hypothetical protein
MKKVGVFFILLVSLFSCKNFESDAVSQLDTIKYKVPTADKDANGCLISAGFIWSKINSECVKLFTGIALKPIDNIATEDETLCTFVLFDESGNTAEIFLPGKDNSVLLERTAFGKPWKKDSFELIAKDGYILKKEGKVIFSGDGEIGTSINGSSDTENDLGTE